MNEYLNEQERAVVEPGQKTSFQRTVDAMRTELLELVEGEDTTLADQIRDLILNLDEGILGEPISAECKKCGTDLVGTQWEDRGLSCPVCDQHDRIAELERQLAEVRTEIDNCPNCSGLGYEVVTPDSTPPGPTCLFCSPIRAILKGEKGESR